LSKSASFAKHRMREIGNTQYRPEQQDMCSELRHEFPDDSITMEVWVHYEVESGRLSVAIIDIMNTTLGVCYRLNGAIHNNNRAEIHDWEQRLYLESLGYLVIDVSTTN